MYNLEHKTSLAMKYHTFTKENENKFKKQKYNIKNLKTTHDQLISEDDSKKPLNLTQSTQEYYDEAKKGVRTEIALVLIAYNFPNTTLKSIEYYTRRDKKHKSSF